MGIGSKNRKDFERLRGGESRTEWHLVLRSKQKPTHLHYRWEKWPEPGGQASMRTGMEAAAAQRRFWGVGSTELTSLEVEPPAPILLSPCPLGFLSGLREGWVPSQAVVAFLMPFEFHSRHSLFTDPVIKVP